MKNYVAKLRENEEKGFSLVELIIVMAIMAILVGVVASQVIPYMEKSRQSKDQQQISSLATSMVSAIAQDDSFDLATKAATADITFELSKTNLTAKTSATIESTFAELCGQADTDAVVTKVKSKFTSKKAKAKSKKKKDSFLDSLKADLVGVSKTVIKKGKKTVAKIKKSYDEKGFVYKALQYGKAAVKVGEGVVKIAGAVALVAGSGGAALPVATCLALSACNDVYNAMMDATYTYTGDFNKIGNTNLLKEFLVKQGRETGEALFGDKKLGEKMGNWVYTGLDIVSFLNGVDQLGKSFGKFQTAMTGTAGTSKVWGEIHMKDVIENTHKLYKKDGIIKTVLRIDPTSVGNFGYDVVTGAMKAIQSAGKLGSTIADLAFG